MRMKSPFPGMDPYLERHWGDVHASLIIYAKEALQPGLPADLVARAEERVFVETDLGARRRFVPDVHIAKMRRSTRSSMELHDGGTAVAQPEIFEVLEEEISLLRQQIDFQNDEIERLRVIESENARQRPEEFESRLHSLQKLLDTREAQIEKLHKEINTREGQIERLQTEWISPEQRIELDDQIGSLRHQIAFLEEEINRLQRLGSENSNQIREDFEARLNSMQNLLPLFPAA